MLYHCSHGAERARAFPRPRSFGRKHLAGRSRSPVSRTDGDSLFLGLREARLSQRPSIGPRIPLDDQLLRRARADLPAATIRPVRHRQRIRGCAVIVWLASGRSRRSAPGVNDAGRPVGPPGGHVWLRRCRPHVQLPGQELFFSRVHLHGGPPRCAASCPNWSTSSSASRSIGLGLRPRAAASPGRRGLPHDGRTPRHQDPAAPVTWKGSAMKPAAGTRPAGAFATSPMTRRSWWPSSPPTPYCTPAPVSP